MTPVTEVMEVAARLIQVAESRGLIMVIAATDGEGTFHHESTGGRGRVRLIGDMLIEASRGLSPTRREELLDWLEAGIIFEGGR